MYRGSMATELFVKQLVQTTHNVIQKLLMTLCEGNPELTQNGQFCRKYFHVIMLS